VNAICLPFGDQTGQASWYGRIRGAAAVAGRAYARRSASGRSLFTAFDGIVSRR
jgi:hypothetical protein